MAEYINSSQAVLGILINMWNGLVDLIPQLIAAVILVFIGYIIAVILGKVVSKLMKKFKLDEKIKKEKLTDGLGNVEFSTLCGNIIKWYVFIIFLGDAAAIVNLGTLSVFLNGFLYWLPNVIIAIILMVLGLMLTHYIADHLEKSKVKSIKVLGPLVRIAILFFVAIIAFSQLGLYLSIAENTFLILVGGLTLAVSLAFGISFGFGLKDEAKTFIGKVKKKI